MNSKAMEKMSESKKLEICSVGDRDRIAAFSVS